MTKKFNDKAEKKEKQTQAQGWCPCCGGVALPHFCPFIFRGPR